MPTTNLEKALASIARKYAPYAKEQAIKYAPNKHLKASIQSKDSRINSTKYRITVSAHGPDARAREYGSGIHSQLGPKEKYPIVPVNAPALVFFWEKANDNIPRTEDGRVILQKVMHPGVEAANDGKGYIGPALVEVRKKIKENLSDDLRSAIVLDLKAAVRKA